MVRWASGTMCMHVVCLFPVDPFSRPPFPWPWNKLVSLLIRPLASMPSSSPWRSPHVISSSCFISCLSGHLVPGCFLTLMPALHNHNNPQYTRRQVLLSHDFSMCQPSQRSHLVSRHCRPRHRRLSSQEAANVSLGFICLPMAFSNLHD